MQTENENNNEEEKEEKSTHPSSQPLVLKISNNTNEIIENVELFNPSVQIDNNECPKQGITIQSCIEGVSYKKILYGINSPSIIGYTLIRGVNEEKPLEFLQYQDMNIFREGCSRLLKIEDRSEQEVKNIVVIKSQFKLNSDVSIIIPFILPEQTLEIYFYPAFTTDSGLSRYLAISDSSSVDKPCKIFIEKEKNNIKIKKENSDGAILNKIRSFFKRMWLKIFPKKERLSGIEDFY